jgi:type II secretory pathway component GspD/PulD (secretin)
MQKLAGSVCLMVALSGMSGLAQPQPAETKPAEEVRAFFLTNLTDGREAHDILGDLRNMVPRAVMSYVESEGALTVRGTAEDIAQAEKLIHELDRKRKVYKIVYSITETDGGKVVNTQHVELMIPTGAKTVVKQGSRVPIVTGTVDKENGAPSTQVQYLDTGLNIEATVEGNGDAVRLRTQVEQSKVADEKSGMGAQDPVIQQTKLEAWTMLTQGKPTLLGSLDIPGSTRHVEVSVVSEPAK